MCMKSRIFISMLMACLPWLAMAQTDDDLYFVPKKETKTVKKTEPKTVVKTKPSTTTVYAAPGSTVVVKDVKGNTRDIDEYNRRYTSRENTFRTENDTLYIEEKPYDEQGEWVNGFEGTQDDYEYAMRIVRFRNPRYAIPVSSPLYWDLVYGYGAYPSWDWNVYDDGFYAYVFPTYSNPMWWNWRWNWSYGWGWHSPWYYSSWYSPYYYGGYWGGYGYYGGWGWGGPHHHGPYYGWADNHFRPGHTDYRPSRYNYGVGNRGNVAQSRGDFNRYNRPSGTNTYSRSSRATTGRVVTPNSSNRYQSVRPSGNNSSFRRGTTTGTGTVDTNSRSVTRQGTTNSYVRPNSVTNRSGSSYDRPSSTRRSVNYGNSSESRSNSNSYQSSPSSSSRGSYSTGGGGFSRGSSVGSGGGSMGGGSSRGSMGGGGSSRRR